MRTGRDIYKRQPGSDTKGVKSHRTERSRVLGNPDIVRNAPGTFIPKRNEKVKTPLRDNTVFAFLNY